MLPPVEIAGVPVRVRVLPAIVSPVTLKASPVAEIGAVRVTVLVAGPPKRASLPLVQTPPKLASVVFQLPVAAPLSQVRVAAFVGRVVATRRAAMEEARMWAALRFFIILLVFVAVFLSDTPYRSSAFYGVSRKFILEG